MPIGDDEALATYIAVVVIGSGGAPVTLKFAFGEVWVKQAGEWKSRYYQATILKERRLRYAHSGGCEKSPLCKERKTR